MRVVTRKKVMLAVHNLIAHPIMEFCWWEAYMLERVGFKTLADFTEGFGDFVHDITLPKFEAYIYKSEKEKSQNV